MAYEGEQLAKPMEPRRDILENFNLYITNMCSMLLME